MAKSDVAHLQHLKVPECFRDFRDEHFNNPNASSAWLSFKLGRSPTTFSVVAFGSSPGSGKSAALDKLFNQTIFTDDHPSSAISYVAQVDPDVFGISNLKVQVINTQEVVHDNIPYIAAVDQYLQITFNTLYPNFILVVVDISDYDTLTTENSNCSRLLTDLKEELRHGIDSQHENVVLALTSSSPVTCETGNFLEQIDSILYFTSLHLGLYEIFVGIDFEVISTSELLNKKYLMLPSGRFCFTSVLEALLSCSSRYGDELSKIILIEVIRERVSLHFEKLASIIQVERPVTMYVEDQEAFQKDMERLRSSMSESGRISTLELSSKVTYHSGPVAPSPPSAVAFETTQKETIVDRLKKHSRKFKTPDLTRELNALIAFFYSYNYKYRDEIPGKREEHMRLMRSLQCHRSETRVSILKEVLDLHVPTFEPNELRLGVGYVVIPNRKAGSLVVQQKPLKISSIGCYLPENFTGFTADNAELQEERKISKERFVSNQLNNLNLSIGLENCLPKISPGFNASAGYMITESATSKSSAFLYQKTLYKVQMDSSQPSSLHPEVHRQLRETVRSANSSLNPAAYWKEFFESHGTHYVSDIELGGALLVTVSEKAYEKMSKATAGFHTSQGTGSFLTLLKAAFDYNAESRGGDEGSGCLFERYGGSNIDFQQLSTNFQEAFDSWRKSVEDAFCPLKHTAELKKISTLIEDPHLKVKVSRAIDEYYDYSRKGCTLI